MTDSDMENTADWESEPLTEDDQVTVNIITDEPTGSLKQKKSSLLGESMATYKDNKDYTKLGRCRKSVRFQGSVTVVVVDYKEDGVSVVSRVSSQLLKDGADADTGRAPYRTSSFERLNPISKYLCFGK